MSCCAPGAELGLELSANSLADADDASLMAVARDLNNGLYQLELGVPDVHCASCIRAIEQGLLGLEMVDMARVNLSTKRVRIILDPEKGTPSLLIRTVKHSGHRVILLDGTESNEGDKKLANLVRALAVAGFAAGNIMLFSVSVWSGADALTRDMFHWISALIAIPAVGYAGRPFFNSALNALRYGRLNMDVPIALAVLLSLAMSVFETARGAENAYFDAAVSLLFFLLIGRTLDHMMREKARGAVKNLTQLTPRTATLVKADDTREAIAITDILPGIKLALVAGQRVPVDAEIVSGTSEADVSLVTGEADPELVESGSKLLAGTMILTGAIIVRAEQQAAHSFLARMIELMEAAEGSRAGYRRIADRAAAIYAPAVHLLSLLAFLGWGIISGDWHLALLIAISVLIITCPCALALAVPMVHIVASGRLFEAGIVMKDGAALERMADVTHVVFDKTGTLTKGHPTLFSQSFGDALALQQAGILARLSTHPFSRAIATAATGEQIFDGQVREIPGKGVEGKNHTGIWRLGQSEWCNGDNDLAPTSLSRIWLSHNGVAIAAFDLQDSARDGADQAIKALKSAGYNLSILSGDRAEPVRKLAHSLGLKNAHASLTPADKVAHIKALQAQGHKVLMIGDGINDAPALRQGDVSMAPASAADVGRSAADFIFTRNSLTSVPATLALARKSSVTVRQNFGLAIAYNLIAVPLAMVGYVTPLIAALAMSSSSILVTLNALKLRFGNTWLSKPEKTNPPQLQNDTARQPEPAQ